MRRIGHAVSAVLSIVLAVAVGAGCGWLAHILGSAMDPFLLGAIFTAVISFLQLGTGIRDLLTGIAKDRLEMQKVRLEIEKLRTELARLEARMRQPSDAEVVEYGTAELSLDRYRRWEREERFF